MQFWKKMVLFIVATISIILSFSRLYMVKSNFSHSIDNASKQGNNQHALEKYILENNLVETIRRGEEVTEDKMTECIQSLYTHLDANSELVAFYIPDSDKVISNMEWIEQLDFSKMLTEEEHYWIRQMQDNHYLFFSSYWTINGKVIYIINAYNIQDIYEERDRQNQQILVTDVIMIAISAVVIGVFARYLTKPIKILNQTAKQIADGKFEQRVDIRSKDEIEELAISFNRMAEEIESKMKQKDDFITGFTHELKTPMTAIVGYADLLRLRQYEENVSKKAINTIYQEAKRLENLSFKLMELMALSEKGICWQDISTSELIKSIQKQALNQGITAKLEFAMDETVLKRRPRIVRGGASQLN